MLDSFGLVADGPLLSLTGNLKIRQVMRTTIGPMNSENRGSICKCLELSCTISAGHAIVANPNVCFAVISKSKLQKDAAVSICIEKLH